MPMCTYPPDIHLPESLQNDVTCVQILEACYLASTPHPANRIKGEKMLVSFGKLLFYWVLAKGHTDNALQ